MPKPLHKANDVVIERLKEEICNKIGFKISTTIDCNQLSKLMLNEDKSPLSTSTLYRFFLQPSKSNTVYLDTLNKLCWFVGYDSWLQFENEYHFKNSNLNLSPSFQKNDFSNLITYNIFHNEYKGLYQYLSQLSIDLPDFARRSLLSSIYAGLIKHKGNNLSFYKHFSELPIVRKIFFEEGADPDFDIKDYEAGLQIYLKNCKPDRSKKELQEYIFGNALLFRHYYLSGDNKNTLRIGKLLYENNFIHKIEDIEIDIFPLSRFFSYGLWYAKHVTKNTSKFDEKYLLEFCKHKTNGLSKFAKTILFYNTLEVLMLANSESKYIHKLCILFEDILPDNYSHYSASELLNFTQPNGLLRIKPLIV